MSIEPCEASTFQASRHLRILAGVRGCDLMLLAGNGMFLDARGFLHAIERAEDRHTQPAASLSSPKRPNAVTGGTLSGTTLRASRHQHTAHTVPDNSVRVCADGQNPVGHNGHAALRIIRGVGTGHHGHHRAGGVGTKASLAASNVNGSKCWICGVWRPVRGCVTSDVKVRTNDLRPVDFSLYSAGVPRLRAPWHAL